MRRKLGRIAITVTTSPVYTTQAIGSAKRTNRFFPDNAQSMIEHGGLKLSFWAERTRHAVDQHKTPMTVELASTTRIEPLLGTAPDNSK